MSEYDDYFTADDKPFIENINDALLISNVFDFTVPIALPDMFSNQTWVNSTNKRKAGVAIVELAETLPNTLSITTANDKSVVSGTGTMKLLFYPNFNSFGQFKAFDWSSSNNKIQVNLKTKTGTTILSNISKGNLASIPSGLKVLDQVMIEIVFTASDTLTGFTVTMENKQQTRYGANVKINTVDGLETRLESIESKNTSQDSAISNKVDKVTGKALSSNDFTNALKSKLEGIDSSRIPLEEIVANDDLNDSKFFPSTVKFYICRGNTIATTLSNCPYDKAFLLISYPTSSGTVTTVTQEIRPYEYSKNMVWSRKYYYNNSTSVTNYSNWDKYAVLNDDNNEMQMNGIASAGSSSYAARSDHVHPSDNTRASVSHVHGNLSADGKIGSSTGKIITTGTNGVLQAVDTITKSKISDFPTSMTPTSHTHGNISNAGAIGSASGKIIMTGTDGALTAVSSIPRGMIANFPSTMPPSSHTHGNISNDGEIGSASGKIIVTGTNGALQTTDTITKSKISDFSHTHGNISNDGKIGSASGKIVMTGTDGVLQTADTITKSKISDFPTSMTPTSHTHGNISNDGKIGSASGKIIMTGTDGALTAVSSIPRGMIANFPSTMTPTSHATSSTTYGVSSATNYGHSMASSTSPKMDGTASVGSETGKFARGDHIHPSDTTKQDVSGLKWQKLAGWGKISPNATLQCYYNDIFVAIELQGTFYETPSYITTSFLNLTTDLSLSALPTEYCPSYEVSQMIYPKIEAYVSDVGTLKVRTLEGTTNKLNGYVIYPRKSAFE